MWSWTDPANPLDGSVQTDFCNRLRSLTITIQPLRYVVALSRDGARSVRLEHVRRGALKLHTHLGGK
jgi:hypothetical protein